MFLSNDTFNYAVNLKRQGDYIGAIRVYREEIEKMIESGDFHEYTTYAHAMAKCYYLRKDYYKAKLCYRSLLAENVLRFPVLQGFVDRDPQFMNFASGWATHIGYVLHGWDNDYAGAIAGKGNDYDDNKYFDEGINFIVDMMIDIINHQQNRGAYVKGMFFDDLKVVTRSPI